MSRKFQKIVNLFAIGLIALVAVVLSPPIRTLLHNAYMALETPWRLAIDLIQVALVSILFAALLAPLEALGWWAGWYGDEVQTILNPGELAEPFPTDLTVTRYVVYLDGISQAQYTYLPEVERFLEELAIDLPDNNVLIKGIMPYSVLNLPLTENRFLSFFWRLADRFQTTASGGILGLLIGATINIRNILIVSVAADQRYGPIYNQGTAQIIYNSLVHYGYQRGSGLPVTLLGYSGGAQMAIGAAPYLKRVLKAPIEVISLSGVMSGNHNVLELEHLYHLVGKQDWVEKEGPIMFPRRWKIFSLSYWNRAKRRGKITFHSLGAVGHNGAQGPYGAEAQLPDGRSHLQQTVELISGIIQGNSPLIQTAIPSEPSHYDRYQQADFNHPGYYPIAQSVDAQWYRPIAPWIGRLILPNSEQRKSLRGVLFEVHHAAPDYANLVGQTVTLRWSGDPKVQAFVRSVTKTVHFSDEAKYSQSQGIVHPCRLNHWRRVDPLESLAGSRPADDVIVMLRDPIVEVKEQQDGDDAFSSQCTLFISDEPVQISGRFYGLVKILHPIETETNPPDRFRVVHFNLASRHFDGAEETVCFPPVIFAAQYGVFPSTTQDIEQSPANETGWYIYGAYDQAGVFTVQSIAPRALLRLQPDNVIFGKSATWNSIKREVWKNPTAYKRRTRSILLCPHCEDEEISRWENSETSETSPPHPPIPSPIQTAIAQWQEGDEALVLHVYGGIGGRKREPAASTPIFFGHFAYGTARVVREPLADELKFEIDYHQVYTHNTDGIVAGTLAWNRFVGDRQFGWMGTRPTCDILIKLDAFTQPFDFNGVKRSALDILVDQLRTMTARYRIGDGTGGTYIGFAHNCAQDSNQALYTALKQIRDAINADSGVQTWLAENPDQAYRFEQLVELGRLIKRDLLPFGSARADWKRNANTLGISPEEEIVDGLWQGLMSWRTLLPRLASETVTRQFLDQGALIWVLRTDQVGGYDPDIEPIAPTPIG